MQSYSLNIRSAVKAASLLQDNKLYIKATVPSKDDRNRSGVRSNWSALMRMTSLLKSVLMKAALRGPQLAKEVLKE